MSSVLSQNESGNWVPGIPLPLYGMFKVKCECGVKFWTIKGYQGHYALTHILPRI